MRYRGYYQDVETGLYHLQSRYYDPDTCRMINADDCSSLVVKTGEKIANNSYVYGENNPISNIDPSGCFSVSATLIGLALDVVFTLMLSLVWVKIGYDIIGAGLKWYLKRYGLKPFYEKLMYGVVPKVQFGMSKFLTAVRKTIYRVTGHAMNATVPWGIGELLKQFIKRWFDPKSKYASFSRAVDMAARMLSLGSMIALLLDWADGRIDNRVRLY